MRKLLLALSIFFFAAASCWSALEFPQRQGAVNDFANVIPAEQAQQMEALAIEIWDKAEVAVVICTMPTIGDEDFRDYANRLYAAWGIGKAGKDNGVLILNVVDIRKIWIEVGYGAEGYLNDARVGDIYREQLVPNLRQGDYGKGFLEAVQALAGIIAQEYDIEFTGETIAPRAGRRAESGGSVGFFVIALIILFLIIRSRTHSAGAWGSGPFSGGRRHSDWGGFGGGFGGGGFGGGFGGSGGFGGFGGGMSGGGGAGGGY